MKLRLLDGRLAALFLLAFLAGAADAQSDKPVSLVVGYSAGGSADFVARVVGAELSKRIGRQVIVENVAGASGMLALQKVLNAPAEGNLIYMGGTDTVVVPMVNPKVKVDWERDLQPVGRLTTVPMVFAVPKASPYSTLPELIAALRKGKENFNYATPGIGTMQHLYGALIVKQAKVTMLHIPYRGGAQIANDTHIHTNVLVDLRRIDVHVDLLGIARIRLQVARDAIVEAHAERDEQVGLLD